MSSELYQTLVHKKAEQARKSSNEDNVYGLGGASYPPGLVRPRRQPRLLQLKTYSRKTYTSSKLSGFAATASTQHEHAPSSERSPRIQSASPRDDHYQVTLTAKTRFDDTPMDTPLRIALLTDNHQRTNADLSIKTMPKTRKEYREISRDSSPVALRMNKRRQQSLAKIPIRKRRSAARKSLIPQGQSGENLKAQAANEGSHGDQKDDGPDSQGSEESLNLEERIRQANSQQLLASPKYKDYKPTTLNDGGAQPEFETDESEYESASAVGDFRKQPQPSQSLLDIKPKQRLSSIRLLRNGKPAIVLEGGDGDDKSAESASSDQDSDEEKQLDDLDRELLGLEGNGDSFSIDQNHSPIPGSPKRRRPSPERDSPDLHDIQNEIEDEEDDDSQQPTAKKRRRSDRTNQKVAARNALLKELKGPRASKEPKSRTAAKIQAKVRKPKQQKNPPLSLPVDEFTLVSERLENLDAEDDEETPIEVPEDPISQLSLLLEQSHSKKNRQKSFRQLEISVKRGKGFGTINISEFRIPKTKTMLAEAQRQETPSHSDGFEGQEAQPTGRLMPVRKQGRHKPFFHKLTIRLGELTLVSERPSSQLSEEIRRPHVKRGKDYKRQITLITPEDDQHDGSDPMIVDDAEDQPLGENDRPQQPDNSQKAADLEETIPSDTTSEDSPLQRPSRSFPLKQKEQRLRKVTFEAEKMATSQPSQTASTQSGGFFGPHESNEVSVSQQLKMITAPKVAATPKKKEIAVNHQLMMVSIPRSLMAYEDSEDDSGEDSFAEDESGSESSEDSEEERSDTPEEETDDEEASYRENEGEGREQQQNTEMVGQHNDVPASPKGIRRLNLAPTKEIEPQAPTIQIQVPTFRREDAQNPLIEMNPKPLPKGVPLPSKPLPRRRSARLPDQQAMVADEPQLQDRNKPTRRKSVPVAARNDDDDSWRPHEPVTSSMPMEVEGDEIVNTPSPIQADSYPMNRERMCSRTLSKVARTALNTVSSRPPTPRQALPVLQNNDSQGSVELGDTQNFFSRSLSLYIPETQVQPIEQEPEEEQEEEDEIPTSQMSFAPESNYFERSSQNLQRSFRKSNLVRSKSMYASTHTLRYDENGEVALMAGGITMTANFQHTISPVRSSGPLPTLLSSSSKGRTFKSLTRQASIELGALPSGKRTISLPFVPPFKK